MSTAVIFDMDGTLFDTEAVFQKYWNAIAKERGIVLPDAFKYEICGTSGEVMNRIIEKHYRVKDGTEIQRECKQRVAKELARGGSRSRAICRSAGLRPISLPLRAEMKSFMGNRRRIFFCWPRKSWGPVRLTATSSRTVRMASARRMQPA